MNCLKLLRMEKKAGWFESGKYDISEYDGLKFRVRGDGRKFTVNIQSLSLARQDDVWQSFMFTRGGPEWEDIKVRVKRFSLVLLIYRYLIKIFLLLIEDTSKIIKYLLLVSLLVL